MLAALILGVHVLIIAFNILGLVAVPPGAWLGWHFVHAALWRLLHLASLSITALQSVLGEACFLTVWQSRLSGQDANPEPLVMQWVNSAIFWSLPIWAFTLIYVLAFAFVLALLRLVPLRRRRR